MKRVLGLLLCLSMLAGGFLMPASAAEENYALGKAATASSVYADNIDQWGAGKAFDGNSGTRWASKSDEQEYWIQVDLGQTRNINKMTFHQYESRVTQYSVEVSADGLVWSTAKTGTNLGEEISFPEVSARHVRFNILSWTSAPTFYEIVITNGTATPVIEKTANLAKNKPAQASSEHSTTYAASMAFDGDKATRWASSAGEEAPDRACRWIQVDLGAVKPINQVMVYEFAARIQDYRLVGSADGENWTELKSGTLPATNANTTFDFPAAYVRYVKLETTKYKDDPTIWEIEVYCTSEAGDAYQYYQFADAITAAAITDQPVDAVTGNLKTPLPSTIAAGGLTADVTWQSDNMDVVNTETGQVTRQAEDMKVTITAFAAIQGLQGVPPVETAFELTVKAAADDVLVLEAVPETTAVQQDTKTWDVQQISGFTLSSALSVELELSADNAEDAMVSVGQENAPFAQVQFAGNTYSVAYGSPMRLWRVDGNYPVSGAQVKFRFDISRTESTMDVLLDTGAGWQTILHNAKGMNGIASLDQITAQAQGAGSLSVHGARILMRPEIAKAAAEAQFDFTKLSEEKPMRVTKDLALPKTILGAPAVWHSSNEAALNSQTGAVDPSFRETITLRVSAAWKQESFTKSFRVMFGGNNLLSGAQAQTTGKATGSGGIEQLLDEDMDSPYLTRSTKPYEITIDLPEAAAVSHVRLYEAQESTGKITKFSIQAKTGENKYEEIAQGTEVGAERSLPCLLRRTKQLKVKVEAFDKGSTGFAEITAEYTPTPGQVIEGDLAALKVPQSLTSAITLPAKGVFGSELVWTSGSPELLQLTKSDDAYAAGVTRGSQTKIAELKVDASYQGTNGSQGYHIEITGTGGGGGGGTPGGGNSHSGGGSSSGGSGGIGMQIPIIGGGDEVPKPQPTPDLKAELTGHWGEKELSAMVDQGILKGDGTSLHLTDGVTRAEFASMLARALDLETAQSTASFVDVETDAWYAKDVAAAAAAGLMQGSGGAFRPEEPITREEMAKVLIQAVVSRGGTVPENTENTAFSDSGTISGWAQESVAQAVSLGLLNGFETGEFMPQGGLLREQAAVVIYRLITL